MINEMSSQVYEELEQVFFSKNGYLIPDEERDIVNATGEKILVGVGLVTRLIEDSTRFDKLVRIANV